MRRVGGASSRRGRGRGRAAILVYHVVDDVERDPFGIAVSPETFRSNMELIAASFTPLTMSELSEALDRRDLPERGVAVTFDDGYANNLLKALPVLDAAGVGATVFVATGYIGEGREFWWDELEQLVYRAAPGQLESLVEDTLGAGPPSRGIGDRAAVVRELWRTLHRLPADAIEAALDRARRSVGVDGPLPPRPTHRPMLEAELLDLAASARIEVGAHTRAHPALGAHPLEVQRSEIAGSRADLERWLGRAPAGFAYPFGNPAHDYSPATVEAVREAGFDYGVGTVPGLVEHRSPSYELPRFFVDRRVAADFEAWLNRRFSPVAVRAARRVARRLLR